MIEFITNHWGIIFSVWYLIGLITVFAAWYEDKNMDLTIGALVAFLFFSFAGPILFAFLFNDVVLIKRRR